jgi:hypothetical protein
VENILEGQYGVTTDGRVQVFRASAGDADASSATPELISEGSLITLGPGDVIVYLDNAEAASVQENLGDTRVVGIASGIFSTEQAEAPWTVEGDYDFTFLAFASLADWAAVPAGDVRLTLIPGPGPDAEPPVADGLMLEGDIGADGSVVLLVTPEP